MRSTGRLACLLAVLSLAAACGDNEITTPAPPPIEFLDQVHAVTIEADIVYGTGPVRRPAPGDRTLLLDLYRPSTPGTPAVRPGIVVIHGGGFTRGSKTDGFSTDLATRYAGRGYVAVSIDYRLTGDDPPTEDLATDPTDSVRVAAAAARVDAALAVEWLRDNADAYAVDPNRIAIAGYSAGGVTAMGVAYWDPGVEHADVSAVFSLSGGLYGSEQVIDGGEPPLVMVHGELDHALPQHEAAAERAVEVGLTYEMYEIPGAGHDTPNWLDSTVDGTTIRQHVARFLYDQMDLGALPGGP